MRKSDTTGHIFYQFMIFFFILYTILMLVGCDVADHYEQDIERNEVLITATIGQSLKIGNTNYSEGRIYSTELIAKGSEALPDLAPESEFGKLTIIVFDQDFEEFNAQYLNRTTMVIRYQPTDSTSTLWIWNRFQDQE